MGLLFNLSVGELLTVGVVALLAFGRRLPAVAGQIAGQAARLRRSLNDLRRETGIDRELWEARRSFEQAVPRNPGSLLKQAGKELLEVDDADDASARAKDSGGVGPQED